jgi:hypothetical protein
MNEAHKQQIDQFNTTIEYCENFCVITRGSELQEEACVKLRALISDCEKLKPIAVEAGDEDFANLLLGFQCVATCLRAEIQMWLLLKQEKPDDAWDRLVTAQMAAIDAARAHQGFSHLEKQAQRLIEIEKLVFPPQVFVSTGFIVRKQECLICGNEYEECEHLIGKPYFGRFCHIIARDIEPNHVAIVRQPAEKSCRIVKFSTEGGQRNRMTWRVIAGSSEYG